MNNTDKIESILKEERRFQAPEDFKKEALISKEEDYNKLWNRSIKEPKKFWAEKARELLHWQKDFTQTLDWNPPHAKWFEDGKLNASYNCLDRHIEEGNGDKIAIHWEGEPGDTRSLSYKELLSEVCKCANAIKKLGVKKGDRVTIYMPMTVEITVAVLACARIGAIHSVIFAGFSAEAIAGRNNDAKAKLVITADGLFRKGSILNLKDKVDAALLNSPSVENVLVLKRSKEDITMLDGRDHWWHDLVDSSSNYLKAEAFDSEHPLFILYTSGSTGKPKGVLHSTGGYLLGATMSCKYIFDLKDDDVYWCTADVGWITGHSYIVYGPLSNGATMLMYEGAPNHPDPSRFWELIEKYKVSIFYTAPTAIRSFMKWGEEYLSGYDLSSLRLLGTVGEPINPEAWIWFREKIGSSKCPIVDTWWQTETGSIMISPLPGVTETRPGTATKAFFGVDAQIVDKNGNEVEQGEGGYLVIAQPWPSMIRTIYGDDKRFIDTYWSEIPGKYFSGDAARKDKDGNIWILGRVDDVINVSGHRLSTMEIESALASHDLVAEAAAIGVEHELKGEAIHCFATLADSRQESEELTYELKSHICKKIGPLARPEHIHFTQALPKTRSGKIMRRFLRDIAQGKEPTGDKSTLENFSSIERIKIRQGA